MDNNLKCKRCFRGEDLTQIEGTIICKGCIVMEKIEIDSRKRLKKLFEPPKTWRSRIRDVIINHRSDIISVVGLIVAIIALKK